MASASSRQGTPFRSCRRVSFVCYLMFLVFASWASGTYWCGTYWYRRTAQGGPDQQARRPVAAKAAHPSPVAQPALRRQPSKVGTGRVRECRSSGSIRGCPVMGIPTAIGISFNGWLVLRYSPDRRLSAAGSFHPSDDVQRAHAKD